MSPLKFAVPDAEAVAELLLSRFGFPTSNLTVLLNTAATKTAILNGFFAHGMSDSCDVDDRIVVFFAGHGHTFQSRRGDVGYLVPHDGDPSNPASLIRWQELTHAADLFDAKHIVFFMDACYGGLAVTRALGPGSTRFLRDMLLRPARQVLTAGKANEPVGNLGGPLPGHSPFTGHLLEALDGKAAFGDGVITANGVMAYVYQAVGRDGQSRQTPHYGYLDGEGDFIFAAPVLTPAGQAEAAASKTGEDILVAVPFVAPEGASTMTLGESVVRTKEYLSEDRYRIQLHDTIVEEIRRVILLTSEDNFTVQGQLSSDEFREWIARYDNTLRDLCSIEALLGHWATEATRSSVSLSPRRLSDRLTDGAGSVPRLALRWHPILQLLYSGGIAAVTAGRYDNLRELLGTPVFARHGEVAPVVVAAINALENIGDVFKLLPGHENEYAPRSEYLYKLMQPLLDDLFFLGSDYDSAFDRFEILMSLEYVHRANNDWGPLGRFGWKARCGGTNPFAQVLAEAAQEGHAWGPLRAGLFNGSQERLNEVSKRQGTFLAQAKW